MGNTLLTIGMITRETLMVLENELTFTRLITRSYDDQFAKSGAKIGAVLNVRLPVRFVSSSGQGLILQDLTESSVPVTLNKQYQRSFAVTSADLALSIDDFKKRFINKAMASMANEIDFDGMNQFLNVWNEVGTPGTVPNSDQTYLDAGVVLDNEAAPRNPQRNLTISPKMNGTIVHALSGLFNPQQKIGSQFTKGMMSKDTLGFDWYMDQNCRNHTVGAYAGSTPLANAATAQTGASIVTDGWAHSVTPLTQGDVIQFANVYAVNPQSLESTGRLHDFVVTADVASDSSGNATIPINPAIVLTGPYKNATLGVVNNAVITVNGASGVASQRGLAFAEEAFTFASADLPLYGGLDMGDRMADDQDLKMSIRVIRDYDINMDRAPLRMDLLGGWSTLYGQMACRIAS